ncbi:MAG: siroheme synthase CysG [Wenzhouxiangellaceae bacterium]|nr:siroheme synthase CysG [Wenzhouxiangellaceae bacterium]
MSVVDQTPGDIANVGPAGAWLPLFLHVAGRRVLVAGGGDAARRKVDRLLHHGARVHLIGGRIDAELMEAIDSGRVRRVDALRNLGYRLVIVAERDTALARRALAFARTQRIPVNAVDDPDNCSALLPAIVDRAPVTIAIGTGGSAPELARMIRSRIEAVLPESIGPLARLAAEFRDAIRAGFPSLPRRRHFLNWLFDGKPAEAMQRNLTEDARGIVKRALKRNEFRFYGTVALVGAGPGDPELLTVKALRLIQQADAIVHDALIDRRVLDYARRDAERFDVGKRGGRCSTSQHNIHALLLELARAGKRVVRLKGGDPMVFGRGGEELEFLRRHGIDYSVVPGITAAAGCAAYAGIPLTHRDHAQSVHLITAHGRNSIDRLDWASLARERQTLAFYMAVSRLGTVRTELLRHGKPADTPVAIVENGARPEQRVLTGDLERLHDLAERHGVRSPAMVYIGEVAQLADQLSWWGNPPLTTGSMLPESYEKQVVHG